MADYTVHEYKMSGHITGLHGGHRSSYTIHWAKDINTYGGLNQIQIHGQQFTGLKDACIIDEYIDTT